MHNTRKIHDDIYWLGANDRRIEKFENTYTVPNGMSYNNYLILDEMTCLVDGIDTAVSNQFLENLLYVLEDRNLDFMIVNHMEPDHCAMIPELVKMYPGMQIVATVQAFKMMNQFYHLDLQGRTIVVKENDQLALGKHTLQFFMAPMVHWPEVMVTYDTSDKVLFSADIFGSYGAMSGNIFADEIDWQHTFKDECRRYYACIVGKYGMQASAVLKKLEKLEIGMICPLHAHIWRKDFDQILDLYKHWTSYTPEEKQVVIYYGSVYNNTANAADILAVKLAEKGITNIQVYDTSKSDLSYMLASAFKAHTLVFAAATYNADVFDSIQALLTEIQHHNLSNRKIGLMENGSWAPMANSMMEKQVSTWKNTEMLEPKVRIVSSVDEVSLKQIDELADAIVNSVKE